MRCVGVTLSFPSHREGRTYIWAQPIYTTSRCFVSAAGLCPCSPVLCGQHQRALPFWISRKDASLLDLDHFMETRFHLEGVKAGCLNKPLLPVKMFSL